MLVYLLRHLVVVWSLVRSSHGPALSSGQMPPPPSGGSSLGDKSGLALAAIIGGVGSFTVLPGVGAYLGVIAGWMELNRIKRGESPEHNRDFARIGLWLSIANLALQAVGACLGIVLPLVFGVSIFGCAWLNALLQG